MSLHYISKQGRAGERWGEAAREQEAWERGIISNSPGLRHKSEAFRTQIISLRPSLRVLLQRSTLSLTLEGEISQTGTPDAFPWQMKGGISKTSTEYNCNLQVFLRNGVMHISLNACKNPSTEFAFVCCPYFFVSLTINKSPPVQT